MITYLTKVKGLNVLKETCYTKRQPTVSAAGEVF